MHVPLSEYYWHSTLKIPLPRAAHCVQQSLILVWISEVLLALLATNCVMTAREAFG